MIRKYNDRDYPELLDWYKTRGLKSISLEFLPKTGFIVPGIAAGFIMQTDTKLCILEPFVANPLASVDVRDEALMTIMRALLKEAKDLGYSQAFGFSSSKPMLQRAYRLGFTYVETNDVVVKELS